MNKEIISYSDEKHNKLMTNIFKDYPVINKVTENFAKTQSQFMDNMLTVKHPTPLRNIRQILAEINKSMEALKEAYYNNKKKEIEIKILREKIIEETNSLQKELKEIEIEEKETALQTGKKYINGAIRKISNYKEQYENIMKSIGVNSFDELDFEQEEEEYHIKKAFEQALNVARSSGRVDEGNLMYFTEIGINGSSAQKYIIDFLNNENKLLIEGKEPTINNQLMFLQQMYEHFKGSSKKYAEYKGMRLITRNNLLIEDLK